MTHIDLEVLRHELTPWCRCSYCTTSWLNPSWLVSSRARAGCLRTGTWSPVTLEATRRYLIFMQSYQDATCRL